MYYPSTRLQITNFKAYYSFNLLFIVFQVQYEGESCHEPNTAYFASFSSIFFCIAAISLTQLFICIRAEYHRMKTPSLKKVSSFDFIIFMCILRYF